MAEGVALNCVANNKVDLDFMRTGMDYLVMGNYILDKTNQSPLPENERFLVQMD
jgi:hypothetical protein